MFGRMHFPPKKLLLIPGFLSVTMSANSLCEKKSKVRGKAVKKLGLLVKTFRQLNRVLI